MAVISTTTELESVHLSRSRRRKSHARDESVAVVVASRRPDDLGYLCDDLLQQTLPQFELFLGLHDYKLEGDLKVKINNLSNRHITVTVQTFERSLTLGNILTSLSEMCTSKYVAKMDDDDIYGPEHLHDLLDVIVEQKCEVVGRAMNYIYLEPINLTVRRATGVGVSQYELFSDWVCGGTIMVTREAGKKAGWFGSGTTAVDTHLLTGVLKNGGKIWRTYGTGYIYRRREDDHTYKTDFAKYLSAASEEWVGLVRGPEFGVRR